VTGNELVIDAAAPYPLTAFFSMPNGDPPIFYAERRTRRLVDSLLKHNARLGYLGTCFTLARLQTSVQDSK
jgi:hypothetical protein